MKNIITYVDSKLHIQSRSVVVSRWFGREIFIVITLYGVVRWHKSAKVKLETNLSKQVTFGTFCLNNTGEIFI